LDFIPVLEDTGLIVDAGEWLLESACQQLRHWLDAGFSDLRLAVNLSPRQFEDDGLVQLVATTLQTFNIPGQHLELEMTEGVLVRDTEATKQKLSELVDMGVRIAIDDFGTGYSSLKYLKLFPIHVLKIDRSFVKDIERDASDAAIATAVIALGHALDLEVVAEGVETEAQARFLREQGCHMIQGYWISKPLPPEGVSELFGAPLKVSIGS
jgi:EAL domain-containing protein (putative c-di-GMP-specific phosphodiesterase class I)